MLWLLWLVVAIALADGQHLQRNVEQLVPFLHPWILIVDIWGWQLPEQQRCPGYYTCGSVTNTVQCDVYHD